MPSNTLRNVITALIIGLVGWICLRYLLPLALPFLLSALLALAAEPLVRGLQRHARLPRGAASAAGVFLELLVLGLALLAVGSLLVHQVRTLADRIPAIGRSAAQMLRTVEARLSSWAAQAPEQFRPLLERGMEGIFAGGDLVLERLAALAGTLAGGIVTRLPDRALGVGTFLLAGFMISARLPMIRQCLARLGGTRWLRCKELLRQIRGTVGRWLLAQMKLIGVTFGVLAVGFRLLRIENGLLWAALIALADALPVMGTGVILIPWSAVCFLQGNRVLALGLLALCAVAMILRSVLEPRLVGKELGLDPLVTLVAIYFGYRLWGLGGMLLAPVLAVTAVQFFRRRDATSDETVDP